jgi:hypothetical protein
MLGDLLWPSATRTNKLSGPPRKAPPPSVRRLPEKHRRPEVDGYLLRGYLFEELDAADDGKWHTFAEQGVEYAVDE